MSGIAKPFISPSATNNGTGADVPIEKIINYEVFEKPVGRPDLGLDPTQHIVFSLEQVGSTPAKIVWTFPDSSDRDAELALIKNTVSAVVA